jgi:hypothetical protein
MSSRFDNIQSRSIYVGASTNPDPALGDLGIDGNLGVGTPTPISAVSIYRSSGNDAFIEVSGGGSTLGISSMLFGQGSDQWGYVWNRANQPIAFATNNSLKMILDANGYLGIGTSSPGAKLTLITSSSSYGDSLRITDGVGTMNIGHWDGTNNRFEFYGKPTLFVQYGSSNPLLFGTEGNERMRITPSGYIGIGTSAPQKRLDVLSNANDFVTVGATSLSVGQWAGIHFGYREDNTNYRKSAIVFERTDLTSGNAQGKIHILNGPQLGGTSATLSDAKITVSENGSIGLSTTAPIASLDNQGSLGTYRQRGVSTMVTNILYADGTSATRYEIARATIDYNDWNETGVIEIELYEKYYSDGLKKRYLVTYGWSAGANKYLVEMSGTGANNFQVSIGTPVVISGDLRYLPIYVDLRYYNRCMAVVKTNRNLTTDNPPGMGGIWFNNAPAMTYISDFSADSAVYAGNVIGGNTIFPSGNVGIGTNSPGSKLHLSGTTTFLTITDTTYNRTSAIGYLDDANLYVANDGGGNTYIGRYNNVFLAYNGGGNVGIATTSPSERLAVNGNIEIVQPNGKIGFDVGDAYGDYPHYGLGKSPGSSFVNLAGYYGLTFGTQGSERMRITEGGNVGIGTTNPQARLHLYSSAAYGAANDQLILTGNMNAGNPSNPAYMAGIRFLQDSSEFAYIRAIQTNPSASWDSRLSFWTMNGSAGTPIERMSINNYGNVGINTNDANGKLTVNGGVSGTPSWNNNTIEVRADSGLTAAIAFHRAAYSSSTIYSDDGSIAFAVNGEAMRIATSNNVGIGTSSPIHKLSVAGNISITGGTGYLDFANGDIRFVNSAGLLSVQTYSAGTGLSTKMVVTGDGNVGIGTTTPGAKLEVYGSGFTSSTSALTVRNAVGTRLVSVFDDGLIQLNTTLNSSQVITINSGNCNRYYALDAHVFYVVDAGYSMGDFVTIRGNASSPAMSVGTSFANASAILDVSSRSKGFLPPRMTNSEMVAISSPAAGLVVYDTSNNKLTVYNGSGWVPLH